MIFQDYEELELGKISKLRPFGEALYHGLLNAKYDTNNSYAMWVEEGLQALLQAALCNLTQSYI